MNSVYNGTKEFVNFIGDASMSIVEAMKKIDILGNGILFIIDNDEKLTGCLTDGDIRRWLISGGNINANISEIVTRQPHFIYEEDELESEAYMADHSLRAMPVLDRGHHLKKVIINGSFDSTLKKNTDLEDIPVVIMAGGKGTRLYPYTKVLPKPLIPVGDYPIIEHIIRQFRIFGAKKFYLIVNHKKEMIKAYFGDMHYDYDILFIDEKMEMGTGGGLSLLRDKINTTFILTNCDILVKTDFSELLNYHRANRSMVTIISSLKKFMVPYGVLQTRDEGIVESMDEKPEIAYLTNTGCYIVESGIFRFLKNNENIDFPDIIKRCQDAGNRVGTFPISEYAWMDMGQIDTMNEMDRRFRINGGL